MLTSQRQLYEAHKLQSHRELDLPAGRITDQLEVLGFESFDGLHSPLENQLRKLSDIPCHLLPQRTDVVLVDVGIADAVHQVPGLQSRDMGDHVGQQGVAGDVEGDSETHVGRPLVQGAAQLSVVDGEVVGHVAGRQSHFVDVVLVPRRDHGRAVFRATLDVLNDLESEADAKKNVMD